MTPRPVVRCGAARIEYRRLDAQVVEWPGGTLGNDIPPWFSSQLQGGISDKPGSRIDIKRSGKRKRVPKWIREGGAYVERNVSAGVSLLDDQPRHANCSAEPIERSHPHLHQKITS